MKQAWLHFVLLVLMLFTGSAMAAQIIWDMDGGLEYFNGSQFLGGESMNGHLTWDPYQPALVDMSISSVDFAMKLKQPAAADFFFDAEQWAYNWGGSVWADVHITRYQGEEVDLYGTYHHYMDYNIPDPDFDPLMGVPDFTDIQVWFFDGVADIEVFADGAPVAIRKADNAAQVPEPGTLALLVLALLMMGTGLLNRQKNRPDR
ncbi:MAG: PEP-CTERM sorting domain-containing protein [Halomonadaceae bacterium]|nr:MAG: PEP-CTERM sorting domain-containing protein [Halomonadaceae bacterium]